MSDHVQHIVAAANELFELIYERLRDARGVHLETAIAAAGYLAGASLLRASDVDFSSLEPGSPIIVDSVNESGPKLLTTLMDTCAHNGIDRDTPMIGQVPHEHHPHRSYDVLMELFDAPFRAIAQRHSLTADLYAPTAVRTVAMFIVRGKQSLEPSMSLAVAGEAIVRGSKTVPPKVP
jgi:hypothetical protein